MERLLYPCIIFILLFAFCVLNCQRERPRLSLEKLKQHQLDGFSPMFAHIFTAGFILFNWDPRFDG